MAELIFLANGRCDLKFHTIPRNFKRVEKFSYKKNFFKVYIDSNDSVYDIIRYDTWKDVSGTRDTHLFNKIKGNPFSIAINKIVGEIDVLTLSI